MLLILRSLYGLCAHPLFLLLVKCCEFFIVFFFLGQFRVLTLFCPTIMCNVCRFILNLGIVLRQLSKRVRYFLACFEVVQLTVELVAFFRRIVFELSSYLDLLVSTEARVQVILAVARLRDLHHILVFFFGIWHLVALTQFLFLVLI